MGNTEGPELKFYRKTELETIAEKELEDANIFFDDYRLDIESLITEKYGLRINSHIGLSANHDTYAYMLVGTNRMFIDSKLMDSDRLEKKYRFTLCEELGHYLIHGYIFSNCKTIEERNEIYFSFSEKDRKFLESNARYLGAAFLMPKKMVEKRVSELLPSLNADSSFLLDDLATKMTHDFDINFMPAKIRLEQLGFDRELF